MMTSYLQIAAQQVLYSLLAKVAESVGMLLDDLRQAGDEDPHELRLYQVCNRRKDLRQSQALANISWPGCRCQDLTAHQSQAGNPAWFADHLCMMVALHAHC